MICICFVFCGALSDSKHSAVTLQENWLAFQIPVWLMSKYKVNWWSVLILMTFVDIQGYRISAQIVTYLKWSTLRGRWTKLPYFEFQIFGSKARFYALFATYCIKGAHNAMLRPFLCLLHVLHYLMELS